MPKAKLPPVPPAGRSPHGAGPQDQSSDLPDDAAESRQRNLDRQGRQGNIKVNTTNQGHQQDR